MILENSASSGGGVFCNTTLVADIRNCTLIRNTGTNWGGGLTAGNVAPFVSNCTFYANSGAEGSGVMVLNSGRVSLSNSIIAFGGGGAALTCRGSGSAELTCCDIYGNSGGDWTGCIRDQNGFDGNIAASPVFCDAAADVLTLRVDSRCAPFTQPNTQCALIGAWPVGCNIPDPVDNVTWGGLKSLYR
jgi:hypothetical protein